MLGHCSKRRRHGTTYKKVVKEHEVLYVPLLKSLEQMLNQDCILKEVFTSILAGYYNFYYRCGYCIPTLDGSLRSMAIHQSPHWQPVELKELVDFSENWCFKYRYVLQYAIFVVYIMLTCMEDLVHNSSTMIECASHNKQGYCEQKLVHSNN